MSHAIITPNVEMRLKSELQKITKTPTDVDDLGADFLSIAGRKLYAPQGIGALYIRKGVKSPETDAWGRP